MRNPKLLKPRISKLLKNDIMNKNNLLRQLSAVTTILSMIWFVAVSENTELKPFIYPFLAFLLSVTVLFWEDLKFVFKREINALMKKR